MKSYKLVVTGPFNAGKTAFIRTASDIEIVTTERRITDPELSEAKEETTVAMDYGQKRLNETVFHLYGTPGQARFEFMWKILTREMDGFIVMVDSSDKASLMDVKQIIRLFRKQSRVPYMVVANKKDCDRAMSPEEIKRLLSLSDDVPVLPCVALEPDSVEAVLKEAKTLLES